MVNDMTIIFGFITFFTLVGFIAPFMNDEFSTLNIPENQLDSVETGESVSVTSAWSVLASVLLMSIWSFGSLPISLELIIFLPLRVVFWFIVLRNIRGTGA